MGRKNRPLFCHSFSSLIVSLVRWLQDKWSHHSGGLLIFCQRAELGWVVSSRYLRITVSVFFSSSRVSFCFMFAHFWGHVLLRQKYFICLPYSSFVLGASAWHCPPFIPFPCFLLLWCSLSQSWSGMIFFGRMAINLPFHAVWMRQHAQFSLSPPLWLTFPLPHQTIS